MPNIILNVYINLKHFDTFFYSSREDFLFDNFTASCSLFALFQNAIKFILIELQCNLPFKSTKNIFRYKLCAPISCC